MLFRPTYLYIKTHNVTGLKYFGKTVSNKPVSYTGSGKYWLRHLKVHGNDVFTEILGLYQDQAECIAAANEFSLVNNIVESSEWANFKIENGIDGGSDVGHKKTNTANMRVAAKIKAEKMLIEGTHPFMGERGSVMARERNAKLSKEGLHNFQGLRGSSHSTALNNKRVAEGTHNLVKRSDGTSMSSDRVASGTHNWQENAKTVSVVDKNGNCVRVAQELFWAQTGPVEEREYVGITSKTGKLRKTR